MSLWELIKGRTSGLEKRSQSLANAGSSLSEESDEGLKFKGFTENLVATPFVDVLPDWQLEELNSILKWNCFTADSAGRRFGSPHSSKKRQIPQAVPDSRIEMLDTKFNLADKTVLEFGCFEGVHTTALAQRAKSVIAVDARIENVVKTMVRVGFFGQTARVLCCNVEELDEKTTAYLKADIAHHVGVLYHLKDPVSHLMTVKKLAPKALMLDTHYATTEMATKSYKVAGASYRYHHFNEPAGYRGVFAGMYDHAKWLQIDDLQSALRLAGYSQIEIVETRQERNGPRLLLFAWNP